MTVHRRVPRVGVSPCTLAAQHRARQGTYRELVKVQLPVTVLVRLLHQFRNLRSNVLVAHHTSTTPATATRFVEALQCPLRKLANLVRVERSTAILVDLVELRPRGLQLRLTLRLVRGLACSLGSLPLRRRHPERADLCGRRRRWWWCCCCFLRIRRRRHGLWWGAAARAGRRHGDHRGPPALSGWVVALPLVLTRRERSIEGVDVKGCMTTIAVQAPLLTEAPLAIWLHRSHGRAHTHMQRAFRENGIVGGTTQEEGLGLCFAPATQRNRCRPSALAKRCQPFQFTPWGRYVPLYSSAMAPVRPLISTTVTSLSCDWAVACAAAAADSLFSSTAVTAQPRHTKGYKGRR
jgi:hypothetical protein